MPIKNMKEEVNKLKELCKEDRLWANQLQSTSKSNLNDAKKMTSFVLAIIWGCITIVFIYPFLLDDLFLKQITAFSQEVLISIITATSLLVIPALVLIISVYRIMPKVPVPGFTKIYEQHKKAKHDYHSDALDIINRYEGAEGFIWKFAGMLNKRDDLTPADLDIMEISFCKGTLNDPDSYASAAHDILDLINSGKSFYHEESWKKMRTWSVTGRGAK